MKPTFARISPTRTLVATLAVLVAGGCGSAASTDTSTPRPTPKLLLAKAGARVGAADAAGPAMMPERLANYVLDGTLPDLGTQAVVYRWTAHAVDLAAVNRLADALGIAAAATATADGFTATDADATLTVTTNYGATQISYYPGGNNSVDGSGGGTSGSSTGGEKPVTTDPAVTLPEKLTPPVDVPSADEAEGIARALLDRMGVLDGQEWDVKVNDSGGIAVTCAVGEDCSGVPQQVTSRDVSFSLVIDGTPVSGIGWNVTVGERNSIQSVYGEWGSAVVLGTYDLRSTADAFTALKRGDTNYGGREPMAVDDVPVKAQTEPATAVDKPAVDTPAVDDPTLVDPVPPVSEPPVSEPPVSTPVQPIDIHVTGVSLGRARWDAVDGDHNVIDIVPTYVFHTTVDGAASDVEELALDPAAIDFAKPITPVPQPGKLTPEPAPAPESRVPAAGEVKTTPGS
jgi:hypothetical protein